MSASPCNAVRTRVRMFHMDLMNVYHGRIFDLFEEARTEVFRRLGYEYRMTEARGLVMIATGVEASFARPLRLEDEVEIRVTVPRLTRVRVSIGYEVRRVGEAAAAATGHTHFAFVDAGRGRPVPVPAEVLAAIERCPAMRPA